MEIEGSWSHRAAVLDFRRARRQADLETIRAKLRGKPAELLPFEEVSKQLKAHDSATRGLQEIPLEAIVGSVGRYADFSRGFLPRRNSNEERWARVREAMITGVPLPAIEVYQLGGVYFVRDGNHRVSVARQLGATSIQAYVTEAQTKIPLTPDVRPDELIIKAEYANFLERTHLDELRPAANLSLTAPGRYHQLEEQIEVHRHWMQNGEQHEVPYPEAVGHWYDTVYLPVIKIIRRRGILRDFSGRTETDLYLWLDTHRAELEAALGWTIDPTEAALDLANKFGERARRLTQRVKEKLRYAVTPGGLQAGPPPGNWREMWSLEPDGDQVLLHDLLVPLSGNPDSWHALEQALVIARREGGRLRGLYVVPAKSQRKGPKAQAIKAEFKQRCEAANVPGELAIEAGKKVAPRVCKRARWADLVVLRLTHPPPRQPVARLESGFRLLIQRCPRPILAVPGEVSPINRSLLAYDGSPKADEALFLATYLAGRWGTAWTVVTVIEKGRSTPRTAARARWYLVTHGVPATQAKFIEAHGPVAEAILNTAQEQAADLLIMGGYGFNPLVEVVLGSAVDQVLRECQQPVLICR